jgi:hypothetical protein
MIGYSCAARSPNGCSTWLRGRSTWSAQDCKASLKSAKYHCDALAIVDTTVVNILIRDLSAAIERDPAFASGCHGLKPLAGELGVTHEALYRTLAALEKAKIISRDDGVLSLV